MDDPNNELYSEENINVNCGMGIYFIIDNAPQFFLFLMTSMTVLILETPLKYVALVYLVTTVFLI